MAGRGKKKADDGPKRAKKERPKYPPLKGELAPYNWCCRTILGMPSIYANQDEGYFRTQYFVPEALVGLGHETYSPGPKERLPFTPPLSEYTCICIRLSGYGFLCLFPISR